MYDCKINPDPQIRLEKTIMRLYDFTHPAEGLDDWIFFDKNDAKDYLDDQMEHIDVDSLDDRKEHKLYCEIKEEIDHMKYFIAFKAEDISSYFVDDFNAYAKDLTRQILEIVKNDVYELQLKEDNYN